MDGASIPITFSEGQDVIIVCNVSTSYRIAPAITLSTKPGVINMEFDQGTGTITITRATAANEGTYTCTADDEVTNPATISFVLRIHVSTTPTATLTTASKDSAGEYMPFLICFTLYLYIFVPICNIQAKSIRVSIGTISLSAPCM